MNEKPLSRKQEMRKDEKTVASREQVECLQRHNALMWK
jgi:hypothetical protein